MSSAKPANGRARRAGVADQLVEGIVPTDILARGDQLAVRIEPGGGVHGAGFGVERLVCADHVERLEEQSARSAAGAATCGSGRSACSKFSMPHMPQLDSPTRCRTRRSTRSRRSGGSSMPSNMPSSAARTSMSITSPAARSTAPIGRSRPRNPRGRRASPSSRHSRCPRKLIATGTSTGTIRVPAETLPSASNSVAGREVTNCMSCCISCFAFMKGSAGRNGDDDPG